MSAESEVYTYGQETSEDPSLWTLEEESFLTVHDIHPVRHEIEFVRENLHLPREDLEFYIDMSIKGMLAEFVGKLPYRKFSYLKKGDYFEFAGIRVEESYKRAAQMAGKQSREAADWEGFDRIQKGFSEDNNQAVLISPPEKADYSYVNIFTEIAERVVVHLVCYPEVNGSVERSRQLWKFITGKETGYEHAYQFLRDPFINKNSNPREIVEDILSFLQISREEIDKGKQFEESVSDELGGWIKEYARRVIFLAQFDGSMVDYEKEREELELYLEGIFNRARKIKERIDNPKIVSADFDQTYKIVPIPPAHIGAELSEVFYYAKMESPVVSGGSDCLPTQSGMPGISDILSGLQSGNTIDKIIQKDFDYKEDPNLCRCAAADGPHFHCPGKVGEGKKCNHAIIVGKGIKKCPNCGLEATCG